MLFTFRETFQGTFVKPFLLLEPDEIRLVVDIINVVYSHANVAEKEEDRDQRL